MGMRVLIACEFSGRVRDAFIKIGHDAVSCDLERSLTPGPHLRTDVRNVLDDGWDMMLAFPPCTYLSNVGNRWMKQPGRLQARKEALAFVRELMSAPIDRWAIENPVGAISVAIRKPDQIIQPWQHGSPWIKRTCLWLHGLPPLIPQRVVKPIGNWVGDRCVNGDGFVRDSKERALTFLGIARSMAEQWGRE